VAVHFVLTLLLLQRGKERSVQLLLFELLTPQLHHAVLLLLLQRKDWLSLVAVHSDSWLLALAFYKGVRLDREQR
jgi:hypothetical protein